MSGLAGRILKDGSVLSGKLSVKNRKYVFDNFQAQPICVAEPEGYGNPTGTAADINLAYTGQQILEYNVKGTQTILSPRLEADGLDISQDQTDNDGVEYTPGRLARNKGTFVIGTDAPFFFRVKMKVADVTGTDDLCVGFRKKEAYQANVDDYDEAAFLNVILGDVKIESILNNAATVTTDTLFNWADNETHELRVEVRGREVRFKINGVPVGEQVRFDGNGAAITAQDTASVAAYSFDSGEEVVPFIFFLQATTSPGKVWLKEFEYGYLPDNTVV